MTSPFPNLRPKTYMAFFASDTANGPELHSIDIISISPSGEITFHSEINLGFVPIIAER